MTIPIETPSGWRERFNRAMWRIGFAGRMMQLTRCDYTTAIRRAHEALTINPKLYDYDPRSTADQRARIYSASAGKRVTKRQDKPRN